VADGHACSHDEYGMGLFRHLRKLLKMQSKIVVIDKVASAGGAQIRGKRSAPKPAAPMQPPGELNSGLAGRLLFGVLIRIGGKCFIVLSKFYALSSG
jgi:hypothetical protein